MDGDVRDTHGVKVHKGAPCPPTPQEGQLPPPPPGSTPGLHTYPSLRPSMGRGTRPPRSKAEVMLSSWSSPGSQSPPKAVRKRLAGVEGSTSSTSWLHTRNSAWYGSRGPGNARLALEAPHRVLHESFPSLPPSSSSPHPLRLLLSSLTSHPSQPQMPFPQPQQLPKAPETVSRTAKNTNREPFQDALLLLLPSIPFTPPSLLPRETPKTGVGGGWRWGRG